jgi:hypothetical protein
MNLLTKTKTLIWMAMLLQTQTQAQNLFPNGSFETGTFTANATLVSPANNADNAISANGDITGWWRDNNVYWVNDATRAPVGGGNRFLYIANAGACTSQEFGLSGSGVSACKTYKITFDGAGFDHLNSGGGVGLSAFTVEVKYADANGDPVQETLDRRGFTDVNTGLPADNPVVPSAWNSLAWKRLTTYFTIPNVPAGATKIQVFVSCSNSVTGATKGIVLDNVVLEEIPAPIPATGGTCIKDLFCTNVYNSPASLWASDWTEQGDDNSPTAGTIKITYASLAINNVSAAAVKKIYRAINLSYVASATLTFDYATSANLEPDDICVVEISKDGGTTYTILETFIDDGGGTRSYNITPYATANTRIRFGVMSNAAYTSSSEFMYISNVSICTTNYNYTPPAGPTAMSCTSETLIGTGCYVNGNPLAGGTSGTEAGFVVFDYTNTGETGAKRMIAASQMGSTWGTAYGATKNTLYNSAILKRHVGYGSLGTGGIYAIDMNQATLAATPLIDLQTLGVNTGADTRTPSVGTVDDANELPINANQPSWDVLAFDAVGKRSLGGMDISADGNTLWVMNLFQRELVSVNIAGATPTLNQKYTIPDPGCANGDFRPWAVKVHAGKVWVGVTCTGETSQSQNDLKAHIMVLDAGTFSPVYNFPLTYTKGFAGGQGGLEGNRWYPWTSTYQSVSADPLFTVYPTPILSDIEFDMDGSMMVALMDRTGHQIGYVNHKPIAGDNTNNVSAHTGGDILRICNVGGSFQMEQNGLCPGSPARPNNGDGSRNSGANNNQGIGGGEYYWGETWAFNPWNSSEGFHQETIFGGLAFKAGSGEITATVLNPTSSGSSGGILRMSNTTGRKTDGFKLYDYGSNPATFGKANGLGDLTIFCAKTCAVNAGADQSLLCTAGNAPTTINLNQAATWSIVSQPLNATAAIDGTGNVTNMNKSGNYIFRKTVSGCTDDVQITIPTCVRACPATLCLPVNVLRQ